MGRILISLAAISLSQTTVFMCSMSWQSFSCVLRITGVITSAASNFVLFLRHYFWGEVDSVAKIFRRTQLQNNGVFCGLSRKLRHLYTGPVSRRWLWFTSWRLMNLNLFNNNNNLFLTAICLNPGGSSFLYFWLCKNMHMLISVLHHNAQLLILKLKAASHMLFIKQSTQYLSNAISWYKLKIDPNNF
jgi:hypothetical protein